MYLSMGQLLIVVLAVVFGLGGIAASRSKLSSRAKILILIVFTIVVAVGALAFSFVQGLSNLGG